eukprot:m.254823 g.254823  ORF g.254823 m.254823 type:complete len:68 (+) comp18708_c0_seq1:2048-2251(+)
MTDDEVEMDIIVYVLVINSRLVRVCLLRSFPHLLYPVAWLQRYIGSLPLILPLSLLYLGDDSIASAD